MDKIDNPLCPRVSLPKRRLDYNYNLDTLAKLHIIIFDCLLIRQSIYEKDQEKRLC